MSVSLTTFLCLAPGDDDLAALYLLLISMPLFMLLHLPPSVCLQLAGIYSLFFSAICLFMLLSFSYSLDALRECSGPLPAAAALHHHILVVLQHHSVLRVQIEQGDGAEGGGDTAGPRHCSVHRVHQSLHHGVAGGVHVVGQRKATLSQAKEGVIAAGRNDPLVPAHFVEIYIQRMTAASVAGKAFQFRSAATISFNPSTFAPADPSFIMPPPWNSIPRFFGPSQGFGSTAAFAAAPHSLFGPFSPSHPLATTGGPPAMFD